MIKEDIKNESPILLFMDETGDIPKIYVNKLYEDEYMQKKESTFFNEDSAYIMNTDCDVYTTDNKLLLKFRKNVIDKDDCNTLFENMKSAAPKSRGRSKAAGIPENGQIYSYVTSKSTGKLIHQINTFARSGIVGYYDNRSFFGYKNKKSKENMCRTTAYTGKHMDRFQKSVPIFKKIDTLYRELLNDCYEIQKSYINKIDTEYIIEDTVFTTVTVNRNFRTALHQDSGDLKEGFGNLVVVTKGDYEGGYTMFPQYGIGVDCRNGDFILMDVHEWHCNSPIEGEGTRLSFVLYLREKMIKSCPKNSENL